VRAIVTGGAGFIGSNLVDALVQDGDEVGVVDDLSTGRRENLDDALARGATFHHVDMRDSAALRAAFDQAQPEVIFHLAAQIDVRRSVADPAHDAGVNVVGTARVLEAAREAGVRRFVFSSTGGAIYGETDRIPTPEETPPAPISPYGQSKFAGEGYCLLYERLYGLSVSLLRYANVYGPRQDPLGEAGVVAIFSEKALAGERPTVYGDGTGTRDYTHVDDVVRANLAAAASDAVGPFNIGTGVETTALELVELMRPFANGAFEPEFAPERLGELGRSGPDVRRAREELGWEARIPLRDGIERTFEWVRSSAGR